MIILYGDPVTGSTRKVRWALEELAAPYELRIIELAKGAHRQSAFLAVNPNGKVPAIDDAGVVLWESDAILWYLAETRDGLLPASPADRGRVLQWLSWNAYELAPHISTPFGMIHSARRAGTPLDTDRYRELLAGAAPRLEILERHLSGRRYVVGDGLTIADIALAKHVDYALAQEVSIDHFPQLAGWYARLRARPAWQRIVQ